MPKPPGGALLHGFSVDRASPVPIYRQLDAALRRFILDGTLRPAQKLPSTRELAQDLNVSRITVKSVYEQLVAEGYAEARTGAGTFVAQGLDPDYAPSFRLPRRRAKPPEIEISDHAKMITSSKASIRHGKTDGFRPGVPALDVFPVKAWNKYIFDAMTSHERRNLSYGPVTGSAALRQAVSRHLADARGMQADPDQIVITSGAQQAFVMIAFVLLDRGETVWYENPGHIAGRDIMQAMGARVAPVPIDSEGLDLDVAMSRYPNPTVIFTTPSHQQPLGTTMSLVRRLALLNYAQENGAWIIEDDYDSEFRYRGRPLPALSALDTERRVFYVGTFSKSMFASMRLGYIVVPPGLVDTFAKARNLLGQSSSAVVESAMAQFMDDGRFVEHIRKMRRVYRERRDILYDCLLRDCADHLDVQPTDAGMHMLAWLKRGIDDQTAHSALLDAGIESLPLSVYTSEPIERQALVLGFSGVGEKRIPNLVSRMAKALAEF
ncbi:MocR-like pyridoxine biosynthesis transcription factor PdxR [Roseovarius aestuarii]|uniref:HTH-type transcriptional regulatory protein GabR n=1 Tax=Roseovarius aestuarii TaxID=475083 RepID=A0A1X7BW40_9RHOB|nr:PLP-dependent aminotransferase family protein [Roseovarius aestuarii]SMC13858.1 HTH-type transcriptional regulatory protein GabR [Roseovarius aestuarii]